jgi:hypothetical protein
MMIRYLMALCARISGFHSRLLTTDRAAARSALQRTHEWVFHVTPVANVASIISDGLCPSDPGAVHVPSEIDAKLGGASRAIVCLNPDNTNPVPSAQQGPHCRLGIASKDLPQSIGIDWSMAGQWDLPRHIVDTDDSLSDVEVFLQTIRRGSVVVYEAILPGALRVWTDPAMVHSPSNWPFLTATKVTDILRV